jgi:hypothetical protein
MTTYSHSLGFSFILILFFVNRNQVFPVIVFIYNVLTHPVIYLDQV